MFRRIIIWLLWVLAVLIFIMTLGAAALWIAPSVASTEWFRKELENRASAALHCPVAVGGLGWTWKNGIQVQDIQIAHDRRFGSDPIIYMERLVLQFKPEQLFERRLWVDLEIAGLEARLIRTRNGQTNLQAWLSKLASVRGAPTEAPRPPGEDWRKTALALPGDVRARIRIGRSVVSVEDRQAARSLRVYDIALLLNVPSLVHQPISLNLTSKQTLDGKALPPLDLAVSVTDLGVPTPAIRLHAASIDAKCELPGLKLTAAGGLSDMGMDGTLHIDFATLMKAVGPLLPSSLPALSGKMEFHAKGQIGADQKIDYDMALSGHRLSAGGGSLEDRQLGPLDLQFSQSGTVWPEKQSLGIAKGKLQIQENTHFEWQGRVSKADASTLKADLSMDAISVDLKEMEALVSPWMPKDITAGWPPEQRQGVSLKQVHLKGMLPAGPIHAGLKGLTVRLPGVKLTQGADQLSAQGIELKVPALDMRLQDRFPTSLDLQAELDVQRIDLFGKRSLAIQGFKVADLAVTGKDLVRSSKGLFGLSGTIALKESVNVAQINIRNTLTVPRLTHALEAVLQSRTAPRSLNISAQAEMKAPSLKLHALSKHPLQEALHLKIRMDNLSVGNFQPLEADVGQLEARASLGRILDFHINGEAAALGAQAVRMAGQLTLDLDKTLALLPTSMQPKGRFEGRLQTGWQMAGRRPTPAELNGFADRERNFGQRLEGLAFLKNAEVKATLEDINIDLPMKAGRLAVEGIRSLTPLRFSVSEGLEEVLLEGELAVARLTQLPGLKTLNPPLSGTAFFKALKQDRTSVQLSETLHIDPLKIDQDFQASINRLERLLQAKEFPTLFTILKYVDASATASLQAAMGPALKRLTPGLSVNGPIKAELGMELKGGKEIGATLGFSGNNLDMTAASMAEIENLSADLLLQKTYGLQFGGEADRLRGGVPSLSRKVLRPTRPQDRPTLPGDALARRLMDDLGGSMSTRPSMTFDTVRLRGGRLPLELRHGEIHFRLAESLPSLDRFQFDVLDGTVLGDFRLTRQEGPCRLEISGAFSGVDAAQLTAERAAPGRMTPQGPEQDTRLSGRVSLQMPVVSDSVKVLNNLSAGFRLTQIGSRTLERLLYAMDPYEANEAIVKQRALLRKGTPEWVDLEIRHGNLSLNGSVTAAGAHIPLPPVERMNLASLPIHDRLQGILRKLGPVEKVLNTLSANTIIIEKDSNIRFVEGQP